MALTVRPDDEVYQFDTVWLGPDEYTLPIQARYVAWGTWLACFLVAVVILVPLGGGGPGGVLGSLIWSLAVSVVLSRAVMLVVDHERPLRSLPALFSAEARAALAARRRGERSLLLRAEKVTVRDTPEKVLEMRRRHHERAARKAAKRHPEPRYAPEEELGPDWRTDDVRVEWADDWTPGDRYDDRPEPLPTWTVPGDHVLADDADEWSPARVPAVAAVGAVASRYDAAVAAAHQQPAPPAQPAARRQAPQQPTHQHPAHQQARHQQAPPPGAPHPQPAPAQPATAQQQTAQQQTAQHQTAQHRTAERATAGTTEAPPARTPTRSARQERHDDDHAAPERTDRPRTSPFRDHTAPVTVSPTRGRHAARDDAEQPEHPRDRQAAVEARILLPVRKDR